MQHLHATKSEMDLKEAHKVSLESLHGVAQSGNDNPGASTRASVATAEQYGNFEHEKSRADVLPLGKYGNNNCSDPEPILSELEKEYALQRQYAAGHKFMQFDADADDTAHCDMASVHLEGCTLEEVRAQGLPKHAHLIRKLPDTMRKLYEQSVHVEWDRLVDTKCIVLFPESEKPPEERVYNCVTQLKIGSRDAKYPDGRVKSRHCLDGSRDAGVIPPYLNHSSMGTHTSLRLFLAISVQLRLRVRKGDIEMAFPHEPMKRKKWMRCPDFVRQKNLVIMNLYGDVEASKTFVDAFRRHLHEHCGFQPLNEADDATYVCFEVVPGFGPTVTLMWTHMDDFLIAEMLNSGQFDRKLALIRDKYLTDDMGALDGNMVVGANVDVDANDGTTTLHLQDWCEKTCKKVFNCEAHELKCPTSPMDKSVRFTVRDCPNNQDDPDAARHKLDLAYGKYGTFRALLGMANFACEMCFPDCSAAQSILARFANDPSKPAYDAILRLLRWIFYHRSRGVRWIKPEDSFWLLRLFTSSDYACPKDQDLSDFVSHGDTKLLSPRTGGFIGLGGPVSWWSHRQKQMKVGPPESSAEGELIAFHTMIRRLLIVSKRCRIWTTY
jgi:hypothetical protein